MEDSQAVEVDLFDPAISFALSTAPTYQKSTPVQMRVSKADEELSTVLADGSVETIRTLEEGQAIVKNPLGEEYAMGMEKFLSKYEFSEEENAWVPNATSRVQAIENPLAAKVFIVASWGEKQYGDELCFFAENIDGDRYLIGAAELASTYSRL